MTRMKLLTIAAITSIMILGSTIVLAVGPVDQTADKASLDPANAATTEIAPAPFTKRGGGGSGHALKK